MAANPLSGFARVGLVILTFALGCAASVGLWVLWTGRCNEACSDASIVRMMIFLALLPSLAALAAVLLVSTAWPARAKAAAAIGLLAIATIAGFVVGNAVGPGAKMVDSR